MKRTELLLFPVGSTPVSPQVRKKSRIRCKRKEEAEFLYFHKPLNPTSVLPLTVYVCRSLEVGRIVSSSLQKLMMLFLGDHSALLLFMKGAPDTLHFNSSGIKSMQQNTELWTHSI